MVPFSHFTPTTFLLLLFTLLSHHIYPIYSLNNITITTLLSNYPDLSDFTALLTTTGITTELNHRTSLTILAVPNLYLRTSTSLSISPSSLADVIRSHILLQYLTWPDLRRIGPPGSLFPTLLQTTGRAVNNLGSLNSTFNPSNGVVSFHPPNNSSVTCNIISLIKTVPYSISIFTVDSLLTPYDFDLTASETRPPPPGLNITKALLDGHNFNVAASMLTASGVISEFEHQEGGAGLTLFVPTDLAFADLPDSVQLQALSADKKALVLKFHVLCSYYPLGSLESVVNPFQSTLATEDNGAGSFTLNISRVNGSVALNSGLVQAVVTQTVFDQNPVAIFGISNVLLPKEIFGKGSSEVDLRGSSEGAFVGAQTPSTVPPPENSQNFGYNGPSHLSSPPGVASRGWRWNGIRGAGVWVMVLLYVLI